MIFPRTTVKEMEMEYTTKPAIKSLGVTGPLFAILVIALGMFGVDISADVIGAPEKIAQTIDNVMVLVGLVVGIYGRITATKPIENIVKQAR